MPPLQLLRRLLHHHHRHFSSQPRRLLHNPIHLNPLSHHLSPTTTIPKFLSLPSASFSASAAAGAPSAADEPDQAAQSISTEILKDPSSDPLPIAQRLHLSFSHLAPTPSLVLSALNLSPAAGRSALGLHQWLSSNPNFTPSDESTAHFVEYFGRRKDFKAVDEVLAASRGVAGEKCLDELVDRTVRAGRAKEAVGLFEKMESDYGFERNKDSLTLIVQKLCEKGHASLAEKMVKSLADEFFPDEHICDLLIKGWCVNKKLDQAKRLVGEMYRGGFQIGPMAYNSILDCVCKLCRDKDPFSLPPEADKVLLEMDYRGVPRNVETFNVLITNLCKIRKTEDAMKLFFRMGEFGCQPDATTYLVLTRSLYQAARVGEGDEMIDRMKSAVFDNALDKKAYFGFLTILCGIERIDHAMSLFAKMKKDKIVPGIKTYDLLMGKLCAHGRADRANALFNEANKRGLSMEPKAYKLDPRFAKKPKAVKKEKKRETFPEKMARKRRRLRQINLSFVKKPKKYNRRAY